MFTGTSCRQLKQKNAIFGRKIIVCCVLAFVRCALVISPAAAQYYDVGEDPFWIKWKQLDTRNFTIIYPSTLDSVAKRYAWLFDQAADKVSAPLEVKLKKIPIVLHAYNLRSNGLVTWAPKRMELNITPASEGYPQLWDKQLVLHETRHVAQMSKMGDNVIKYLHWFLGEQAEGLFVGIFIPSWYLEGDATVSETALSSSGRGRYASFLMRQKAYLLTDMYFSWDTWKMGSYRYPVPSQYELGYTLSSYAILQGGNNVFGKSLDFSTRKPYRIPPFDVALEKYAGKGEQGLQRESFAELKHQWLQEDTLRGKDIPAQQITATSTDYTAYNTPVSIGNGRLIALRATMNRSLRLALIDSNGTTTLLRAMGQVNSRLVYHNGFIYWSEIVPHLRWPQQNYSQIYCYELSSRKLYCLSQKSRFSGVNISNDGTQLITVEDSPEGVSQLVVMPLISENRHPRLIVGDAIRIPTPIGGVWKQAVWGEDSLGTRTIYATLLSDEGMQIYAVSPENQQCRVLTTPRYSDIKQLGWWKRQLLFVSGFNGTDNVYALSPASGKVARLTNARFGAFTPTFDNKGNMIYSDYHAYGYRLMKVPADSLLWKPEPFTQAYKYAWADQLSDSVQFNIDKLKIPPIDSLPYQSKTYNKLTHLFRFHSWAPIYINPDELKSLQLDNVSTTINWGVTLFTQNSLSTAIGRLGYKYANGMHSGHLAFTYKGWFPIVDFFFDINDRKATQYTDLQIINDTLYYKGSPTTTPYISTYIRLYIPFNFSKNGWSRGLIPQVEQHFTNDRYYIKDRNTPYFYHYFFAGLSWYERLPMAARELYPRWGYMLRGQYLLAPFQQLGAGYVTSFDLTTYAPGLWPNHGFQLKAGFQWQHVEENGYYLQNLLLAPRGYPMLHAKQMAVFSAEYGLPLLYPDWNVSWLAYFKRIQMKVFSDYAHLVQYKNANINEISVGVDLLADYHIFRFDFPVQTGIRCAFPLTGEGPSFSLLFNVSFN